jgi:hypothetical protein
MSALVDLGSAKLNPTTGMVTAQCKGTEREDGQAEDFGDVNMAMCLGFAAVPAPADGDGNAQGFILDDVPGQDGVCVGATDARSTKSYAELGPGETAMFATGKDFDSRVFCKDQLVAIVVGKDCTIVVDRKAKKIALSSNCGGYVEISESNGVTLAAPGGGASIQLKGSVISLVGTVVLGGRDPSIPMCASPTPVAGSVPGTATIPTAGVFWGT